MPTATQTGAEHDVASTPSRSRSGYLLPLVLVVGLLLGGLGGYLFPRGSSTPGDDSPEAGFARDMTTHHTQAVEMGTIAYTRAQDPGVRQMGLDIAFNQQGQIGMMQAWLAEWGLGPTGSRPPMAWMPDGASTLQNGLMPGMATQAELAQLRTATGLDEDRLFLNLMIKHHLGGIHMAQEIVARTEVKQVIDSANTVINSQQRELTDMQTLQKTVGAAK